jgi:hypothetical protein
MYQVGQMFRFLKIFSPKILDKKWQPFMQKKIHHSRIFRKRHFFAENWCKSPKMAIITLTPGLPR